MLKISISGVRGIYGESLTNDVALEFGKAFGSLIEGGRVLIGTDTRPSGNLLKAAVISGLIVTGCEVIDIGIAPTPTVQLMVKELKADGGIVITASHNPAEWNGLKFIRSDGIFLNEVEAENLIKIFREKDFRRLVGESLKELKTIKTSIQTHIKIVLSLIDKNLIRSKKLKVVIDSCNGAGSIITPALLSELNCEVISINTDIKAPFPHPPEPTGENIGEVCYVVKNKKADIGFAQDSDADRLAIVTEKGVAIGEEYTLVLAVNHVLSGIKSRESQIVVTNLSTTKAIDDIAGRLGAKVIRTKIGEVYVAEAMKKFKAAIGGEGNGGVIYPKMGYNRDSLIAIGLILEYLAKSGKKVSSLIETLPKYYMVKDKIEYKERDEALLFIEEIKKTYKNERLDLSDGVKISFQNSWVHIRVSNTEPIIRVISEAATTSLAEDLGRKIKALFGRKYT